jgi:catechol 2,3-dioxygenase-like lactoylglutathione lyase family enzyme
MPAERIHVNGLAYVSMYVDDLPAARTFYAELLDLELVDEGDWGSVVRLGDVGLFLHPREGQPRQHLEVTLDVDDVDAVVDALRRRGVPVVDEPADRSWGDRDGAVSDPDGNVIYLRSEIALGGRRGDPGR